MAPAAPLYAAAVAFALSRPYLGVHYPSDVLAGAVLGTALAGGLADADEGRDRRACPTPASRRCSRALTGVAAEAANYPFTTIEPNVAVVPVADERLDAVAAHGRRSKIVPDTIAFHDIAGLVAGAHRARGWATSSSPTSARPTRSSTSSARTTTTNVVHPDGRVDPLADIETIETELIYADLEQAERRLERVAKAAKSGDRRAVAEAQWLERADRGAAGRAARRAPCRRPPTRPTRWRCCRR